MKKLKKILIWLLSSVCAALIAYVVLKYIDSYNGLRNLSVHIQDLLLILANLPTPLWATIVLIAICFLYIYLNTQKPQYPQEPPNVQEKLHEAFGVYWNNQYKLRCLKCKWPLKCASKGHDPSLFWCSNCNTKLPLRDPNGNPLTEANAIEQLKKMLTNGST